jgi:hypothetical protein
VAVTIFRLIATPTRQLAWTQSLAAARPAGKALNDALEQPQLRQDFWI